MTDLGFAAPPRAGDRFARVLPVTLHYEGGYSNHPRDPGGPTNKGIIQRVYDGYRDRRGLPRQSVRTISDAEARDIYRVDYWRLVRGDELPAGVDLAMFDFGVNSGPPAAAYKLQKVLGVGLDGMMGPATMAAVHRLDPGWIVRQLMAERRAYLRSLRTFPHFGHGWMARCDGVEQAALAMVGEAQTLDLLPHEWTEIGEHRIANRVAALEDPEAQSAGQGRAPPEDPAPPRTTELGLAGGGGSSLAYAAPTIVARATESGTLSFRSLALALLAEPLFWAGMAMLWGALAAWLWRRRHAP